MDGPVVIEAVTDPNEPPYPPKVTKEQAKNLAEALARGDKNRGTIALTMGREALDEVLFPASSYGYVGRMKDALGIGSGKEEEK